MRKDATQADGSVALVTGAVAGSGQADAPRVLPGLPAIADRFALPRPRLASHPWSGRAAMASLVVGSLAVVVIASSAPGALVPSSYVVFPGWEAGPLHFLLAKHLGGSILLSTLFSSILILMLAAYCVATVSVRTMSMRAIALSIVALHAVLLLGPPLTLTDLFNYLGYARLGAIHHLNPYTHVIGQELHDPVFRFTSWRNLHSPYGPLFTAISYPVAFLPIPVAYWVLKLLTAALSLGFVALVYRCARQLGRDPRFAVVFVAANPIYLLYALGGFHNDFLMLVASTGAISLLLASRDRSAGAVLMLAVAVKFTAVLLLPFLLLAVAHNRRRAQVLIGAALAAIVLAALSLALFGFSLPNLSDQTTLLTDFSIPNLAGWALGLGGATPGLLRVANVLLVVVVALLLRRRGDWLSRGGWATLALIASLAWLMPWYVIWVLPLAALGTSLRLRRAAIALTIFLVIGFMPITGRFLRAHGVNAMSGSPGQVSKALQAKLEQ